MALSCFGAKCQVRGCPFTSLVAVDLLPLVVEVHHLRAVAGGGSDSLFNLSVLCANHQRLVERVPGRRLIETDVTDDVLIRYNNGAILIERDLSVLRERIQGE